MLLNLVLFFCAKAAKKFEEVEEKDAFFYTGPVGEGQHHITHPYISHSLHVLAHNNSLFTFIGTSGALVAMFAKKSTSFQALQLNLRQIAGPCAIAGVLCSPPRFLYDVNKKNWMVYDVRNNVHHIQKLPDHRYMEYEAFVPFVTAGIAKAAQQCAVTGFVGGALIAYCIHLVL